LRVSRYSKTPSFLLHWLSSWAHIELVYYYLGIPDMSSWVQAKTFELLLRKLSSSSLSCLDNCDPIFTFFPSSFNGTSTNSFLDFPCWSVNLSRRSFGVLLWHLQAASRSSLISLTPLFVGNFIFRWWVEVIAPSLFRVGLPTIASYADGWSTTRKLTMIVSRGSFDCHRNYTHWLDSFPCKTD